VLLTTTKGTAIMHHSVVDYVPYLVQGELYEKGALISSDSGTAIRYSLNMVQERGQLFVKPGDEINKGMIIGVNK
jgi:GTP-binding protein